MSSFRKFLLNNPIVLEQGVPGYVSSTPYSGPLGLPDLSFGHVQQKPGEAPAGGFDNISSLVGAGVDQSRYGNVEKYQQINTLRKIGIMANYIVIVSKEKDPAQDRMTRRYKLAKITPDQKFITGLPMQGMFSDGGYPELRQEDLDMGRKLRVIIDDPNPPNPVELQGHGLDPNSKVYAIDIDRLRATMIQMEEEMHSKERQYRAINHVAGKADQAWGLMNQPGQMSYSKSANPLSGN